MYGDEVTARRHVFAVLGVRIFTCLPLWFTRRYWDAFDTDIKVALTDILDTPETAEVLGTYWTTEQLQDAGHNSYHDPSLKASGAFPSLIGANGGMHKSPTSDRSGYSSPTHVNNGLISNVVAVHEEHEIHPGIQHFKQNVDMHSQEVYEETTEMHMERITSVGSFTNMSDSNAAMYTNSGYVD